MADSHPSRGRGATRGIILPLEPSVSISPFLHSFTYFWNEGTLPRFRWRLLRALPTSTTRLRRWECHSPFHPIDDCFIQDMKMESEESDWAQEEGLVASKTAEAFFIDFLCFSNMSEIRLSLNNCNCNWIYFSVILLLFSFAVSFSSPGTAWLFSVSLTPSISINLLMLEKGFSPVRW